MVNNRAGIILTGFILAAAFICSFYFDEPFLLMGEAEGFLKNYAKKEGSLSYFWLTQSDGTKEDDPYKYYYRMESELDYEAIIAREGAEEHDTDKPAGDGDNTSGETQTASDGTEQGGAVSSAIVYEKLNDFDYLIQNFYQVDNTTTITSEQLDAATLINYDMSLKQDNGAPQILIYHTHSQEGYADSVEGDAATSVVGVGDELARILTNDYGYNVMHHTGTYDVDDRDRAYSKAGPALEAILAEYPSIEVVIDLHRDGVREDTRLVTDIDGRQTAQIMFFNGLSRTSALGDIGYLYNPYIEDNMAFSFQMQLASVSRYPGFARRIYLKGYRYNMHYCPKTLLVEVGAQTNTVEEAMNAMRPLAEILDSVLTPKASDDTSSSSS